MGEIEEKKFNILAQDILNHEQVLKMKTFIQHGSITTYDHCLNVAKQAYHLAKKYKMNVDEESLVKACLLHDFYLYDWHLASISVPLFKMHGFTHPEKACEKAIEYFKVDDKIQNCILAHMWPLTISKVPKSKEAWLLCLTDKAVALKETVFLR